MDPNATLAELRAMSADIIRATDRYQQASPDTAERLAELVASLDEWIMRGGFLPADWEHKA